MNLGLCNTFNDWINDYKLMDLGLWVPNLLRSETRLVKDYIRLLLIIIGKFVLVK